MIERASTQYISPLVAVIKPDGSVHVRLDACKLNRQLQKDYDGPEDVETALRKCGEVEFMSSVDLTSSFWQVQLTPRSRKFTGFIYRRRTYQHTIYPFGTAVCTAALKRAA